MSSISGYLSEVTGNDYIDFDLFSKFNVKRGLRNADGTGVLVGLTRVGDVHGYIMDEGERIAVDGKLYYRGIDIEDMIRAAETEHRFGFEETVFLLMFGKLPKKPELEFFCKVLGERRALPAKFLEDNIMTAPSRDIMNLLARAVLTLYTYDENPDSNEPENVLRQCIDLIARFPTIIAYALSAKLHYYDKQSLIIHSPPPESHTAETILSLIRPDQQFSRLEAELLDLALILHAEHGGGNNSTFAVHLISSAETDTYSAIASGIGSLKGTKHGGANAKVSQMMEDMKKNVKKWDDEGEVADYLVSVLKGEANDRSGLIYGQGHAVYTKTDPRAILLRVKARSLAEKKNLVDEFNLYNVVERLTPEVFKKVKGPDKAICTNVDFYSGFVYRMLGLPDELATPLFAASRIAGWCAHRMEEIIAGGRIIRPAYKCVQTKVDYVPINDRR